EGPRALALPGPLAPRTAGAVLLPRRRVLGAPRTRDPRERGGQRRARRDRLPERADAVDLRPSAGSGLGAWLRPPARRPVSVPRGRDGRRRRLELPDPVLRPGRPAGRPDRSDGELHAGTAGHGRVPE